MLKLIKNELVKLFSKKSLYIILIIIFGIIFYQTYSNEKQIESYNEKSALRIELDFIKDEIELEDKSTYSGLLNYVKLQTEYDVIETIGNIYGDKSWQANVVLQNYNYSAYDMFYDYYLMNNLEKYFNESTFELEDEDKVDKEKATEEYNEINEIFKNDDWKTLVNMQIEELKEEKASLEQELIEGSDTLPEIIENNIKSIDIDLESLNIRLEKNIPPDTSFFSNCVESYNQSKEQVAWFNPDSRFNSYISYVSAQENTEDAAKYKYDFENNEKTTYTGDTRYKVSTTFSDIHTQIFIIVLIVYFSAGIVSDEINKGTIKQLLSKPHSRFKILLSKFISIFIIIVFSAFIVALMVLISNLILKQDIESLLTPITLYNFNTDSLMVMNLAEYLIISFLAKLPMFLSVATIGFAISTLFNNKVIASIVPICLYIADLLIIRPTEENVAITRNFLTTNWDLSQTYFGRLAQLPSLSFEFSLVICTFYILIFLIPAFIYFFTSDIKNK